LPEVFRRLHPRFKTPALALAVFAGLLSILFLLPGNVDFIGRMYAFGAMLSFTIAHASVIQLRRRPAVVDEPYRVGPNLRVRGVDWPLFAILGGLGTGIAWLVVVVQNAPARWAGLGWLAAGFAIYAGYRMRLAKIPLRETARAPALILGPSLTVEYRTIIVPILRTAESEEALVAAARLADERRARIVIMTVLEIPLELPPDTRLEDAEQAANQALDDAQALVESYGVRAVTRLVRARRAGPAIVREAADRNAELIVLGAPRRDRHGGPIFGKTVDYVLKNAPCRVLIAAGRKAA